MHNINWCEVKRTRDGSKEWKELTLVSGQKVSIWPNHPEYLKAAPGATVSGNIVVKGKYTNLVPTQTQTPYHPYHERPRSSQGAIKAAEVTSKSVKDAQENKELGIKISSTMRMAVDISLAELQRYGNQQIDLDNQILKWRKWCWEHWDVSDKDFAPFLDKNPYQDEMPPDEAYENM